MLKGGTKSVEVVLSLELEVLAILTGGRKKFPSFKKVPQKDLPFLSEMVGGGRGVQVNLNY